MEAAAPADGLLGFFIMLEHSGLGRAARSSAWLYPLANTLHILGLTVFAAAVAIMDLRLIGAFSAMPPAPLIRRTRRVAMGAFAVLLLSGIVLFASEAGKLAANPVFLTKVGLIVLALANVAVFELLFARNGQSTLPRKARLFGLASVALWLTVAAAGRLIAYY